jgi:hypothetical protein
MEIILAHEIGIFLSQNEPRYIEVKWSNQNLAIQIKKTWKIAIPLQIICFVVKF